MGTKVSGIVAGRSAVVATPLVGALRHRGGIRASVRGPGVEIHALGNTELASHESTACVFVGALRSEDDPASVLLREYLRAGNVSATGSYAYVIVDQARGRWVLGRDWLGIQPLYFRLDARGLAVASEPRPLSEDGADLGSVAQFAAELYGEDDATLFAGVRAVPPGATITWEAGRLTMDRPPPRFEQRPAPDDAAKAFRQQLVDAVATSARGARHIAVFMSGGLDSTAVAWAARELGRQVTLFTMAFPGMDCDETAIAASVADHLGLELVSLSPLDHPTFLDPLRAAQHDAYFFPTLGSFEVLARAALDRGCDVALTGMGADHAASRSRVIEFAAALHARSLAGIRSALSLPKPSVRDALWFLREGAALHVLNKDRRSTAIAERPWLTPLAIELLRGRPAERAASVPLHAPHAAALRVLLGAETTLSLVRMERFAARVGLAVAHPFLDASFVSFQLALPPALVEGRGPALRKPLQRAALEGRLPGDVVRRRVRTHFNTFAEYVLRVVHPRYLRALQRGENHLGRTGLVDAARLAEALATDRVPLLTVQSLTAIEAWLQTVHGGSNGTTR